MQSSLHGVCMDNFLHIIFKTASVTVSLAAVRYNSFFLTVCSSVYARLGLSDICRRDRFREAASEVEEQVVRLLQVVAAMRATGAYTSPSILRWLYVTLSLKILSPFQLVQEDCGPGHELPSAIRLNSQELPAAAGIVGLNCTILGTRRIPFVVLYPDCSAPQAFATVWQYQLCSIPEPTKFVVHHAQSAFICTVNQKFTVSSDSCHENQYSCSAVISQEQIPMMISEHNARISHCVMIRLKCVACLRRRDHCIVWRR